MMPPVQPRPTTTASTSLSFVTISPPPLAHIRDAERSVGELLVAIALDVLAMHGDGTREADQLPARFVAIAAIDRVGEHALHHALIHHGTETATGQATRELDLA